MRLSSESTPRTSPRLPISAARTTRPAATPSRSAPRTTCLPPETNARPIPATSTNVAADRPPATRVATVGPPSAVNVGKMCTANIPSNARPRATSTPTTRATPSRMPYLAEGPATHPAGFEGQVQVQPHEPVGEVDVGELRDAVEAVVEAAAVQVEALRHRLDVAREVEERLQGRQQHRRRGTRLVQRAERPVRRARACEQGAVGAERRPTRGAGKRRVERGQLGRRESLPAGLAGRARAERRRIADAECEGTR